MISTIDRATGRRFTVPISDSVTERDFYTSVNEHGVRDGHSDHMLSWVEAGAAPVIERLVRLKLFAPFPPAPKDRVALCMLLAFQMTRGQPTRRTSELLGDIYMRTLIPKNMTEQQAEDWLRARDEQPTPDAVAQVRSLSAMVDEIEFVPGPNAHIAVMGPLALKAFEYVINRPWYVADYAVPSLVTCDEPVVLFFEDGRPLGRRAGLAYADQVWFPLSPRNLLVLGSGEQYGPERRVAADLAGAQDVNLRIAANAYESIHMHPDQDHLADIDLPAPQPLFQIYAPGVPSLDRYNQPLTRTKTRRR